MKKKIKISFDKWLDKKDEIRDRDEYSDGEDCYFNKLLGYPKSEETCWEWQYKKGWGPQKSLNWWKNYRDDEYRKLWPRG